MFMAASTNCLLSEEDSKLLISLGKTAKKTTNSTAKIGFLSICLLLQVIPKDFRNKFFIQTGLPEEYASPFNDAIKKILKSSSLSLMSLVKSAEEKKIGGSTVRSKLYLF